MNAYAKTKAQISCAVTAQLISGLVFAIRMVTFLFFQSPKFQASSLFLRLTDWLMSDLVGNPEDRFSRIAAQMSLIRALTSLEIHYLGVLCSRFDCPGIW